MQRHADKLPPDWERISAEWRTKQLEYSWVRTLTGPAQHRDFWQLTREALAFVAARNRITDPAVLGQLLDAYRTLPAYPDAQPTLAALRKRGLHTAILSNAAPAMLDEAVTAAGLTPLLDAVLSVEPLGTYKPDRRVYDLAAERFGLPLTQMAFVSSNAWDAQAAALAGFRVFWCNRAGGPAEYGLETSATILGGLAELERELG
ncbi:MAG: haloacid dehalogenase type II [Acetobacteraceae bacterium]